MIEARERELVDNATKSAKIRWTPTSIPAEFAASF
jgi:hypothetical protein